MALTLIGICDGHFRGVGLMLISYSLEACLKGMILIKEGQTKYSENEKKKYHHHRLHQLARFIPNLSEKDMRILKLLTYYSYWAGRYPTPGKKKEKEREEIFMLSEKYKISVKELMQLAEKIMGYAKTVVEEESS